MTTPLSVRSALSFGWNTFKKRPWLFIGSSLIYAAAQFVIGMVESKAPGIVSFVVSLVAGTFLAIGLMTLYLKAHDNLSGATFKDMWNPKPFWQYLVTSLVIAVAVMVGLVLLIVPGVILALAFSFAPYIVIEKRVWVKEALIQSWRMTKGNWLKLLLLGVMIALLNFIGALVFLVGLLVTVPISLLAMVHVYRALSGGHVATEAPMTTPVA